MDGVKSYFTEEHINGLKDTFLAFFALLVGISVAIIFVVLGWLIVWHVFLKRFHFIKELFYGNGDESPKSSSRRSDRSRKKEGPHDE